MHKLVERVKTLARENPDVVYLTKPCLYTEGESCAGYAGCLIGVAIQQEYPDLVPTLEKHDGIGVSVVMMVPKLDINISEADLGFLSRVQDLQDNRVAWGECLDQTI